MARSTAQDVLPDVDTMADNIVAIYGQATQEDLENGASWYALAHLFAAQLDRKSTDRGAAVIAALSPQTSWSENCKLATRAYSTRGPSGHLKNACDKARAILQGHTPLDVLGGNKVRAFYTLIANPLDAHAVCIDRHALRLAIGETYCDALDAHYAVDGAVKVLDRKGAYDLVALAYRKAAADLGTLPHIVQAVTWLVWRKLLRTNHESTFAAFTIDESAVQRERLALDKIENPEDYF